MKGIARSIFALREFTRIPVPLTRVAKDKWDPALSNVPLKQKDYTHGPNGNIVRKVPKRDKSISARQWKIQKKDARRAAKVAA